MMFLFGGLAFLVLIENKTTGGVIAAIGVYGFLRIARDFWKA